MRVNSIQNKNSQSFGMAFRLKGSGAKQLAEKFHAYSDPKIAEQSFIKDYIKPLQKLSTDFVYDGENLIVHDVQHGRVFNVLDSSPIVSSYKNATKVDYPIKDLNSNAKAYTVFYPNGKNPEIIGEGLNTKFAMAKEIGKDLEGQNLSETVQETASRLQNLFG